MRILIFTSVLLFFLECNDSRSLDGFEYLAGELISQYPEPVSISPDLSKVLLKTRDVDSFELFIHDFKLDSAYSIDKSHWSQLSLNWSPADSLIIFQCYDPDMGVFEFHRLNLLRNSKDILQLPPSLSAIPPIEFSHSGRFIAILSINRSSDLMVYDLLCIFRSI